MVFKKVGLFLLLLILITAPFLVPDQKSSKVIAQDNTLSLPGLQAPVTVIYDQMGIPHIYAENVHDLFMTEGYVEAVDRFWQMDWWRHQSSGSLSEIAGDDMLGSDRFFRTLNFRAAAERDLSATSPEALAVLEAYAEGVNAYLADKAPSDVAVEYSILAESGVSLEIAPWTPNDTLRWFKVMALGLSGNFQTELFRAGIIDAVGQIAVNFLIPTYPFDLHPVIIEPGGIDYTGTETTMTVPENIENYSQVARGVIGNVNFNTLTPFGSGRGIGSNSWAIGKDMTDSGMPYLANDPHLGIQNPSIWYEVGLHCVEVSPECPFDVVGISFAGTPGIVIGHNANIGWGFTNVGTDVQDLYTLTVNPDDPNQYMLDGEWVDFEVVTETLNVQGSEPVELTIRNSVWGPVISEVIGFEQVFALRWTALDANTLADALLALNTAANWEDFRSAASMFDVPAQNMLYVDVEGNIGYQTPGKTPIRVEGHSGKVPVDGSTSENAWQGYIPFEEMPMIFNPEAGYIVTANNSVVPKDFPYYLTDDWDYGYRAARIEMMIQNDEDGVITLEEMQAMQGDNYNLKADYLIPALQALSFEDEAFAEMVAWLGEWSHRNDADSGQAGLFEMFWWKLLENTFVDDLGFTPSGSSDYWYLVSQMVANPQNVIYATMWDDKATPDVTEVANDVLAISFSDAVAEMVAQYGEDHTTWSWGAMHIARFQAAPLGQMGDSELDALFNVEIGTGGGDSIVNATGWSAGSSFEVDWVPSMRQILTPGNWDGSMRINTLGQSGNPFSPHYKDQVEMWANVEYHPDWFTREAVEADASAIWTLEPAE